MKNIKKVAAMLALIPSIASSAKAMDQSPDPAPVVVTDQTKEDDLDDKKVVEGGSDDSSRSTESMPENWVNSRINILNVIDREVTSNRDVLQGVLSKINDPANDKILTNPTVMGLRDAIQKSCDFCDSVQTEVNDISTAIYGNSGDMTSLDNRIIDLDKKVLSDGTSTVSLARRWETISKMLHNYDEKTKVRDELAKRSTLNQIKARMDLIRADCKTMTGDLKKLEPAVTADIQTQLDEILSGVKGIQEKIINPRRMTLQASLSLSDQVNIHYNDIQTLKTNLNEMIVAMSKITNERVLRGEKSRLDSIKRKVDVKLDIVLEERVMSEKQFARLNDIKTTTLNLFDETMRTLDNALATLDSEGKAYDECPPASKIEWHKLVNSTVTKINAQLKAWDAVMSDIRKDDLLRKSWDPIEGAQILRDKMTTDCAEIISSKDLNIKEKTVAIARCINKVQPGTGTSMLPLIRSFLDPNRTMNITDNFGNVVADRLAPYSFQLTGLGGTGKTSGACLVADAFSADVVIVSSNDLKDQNAFNLKKNELITKLGAPSKKGVLVVFDEVDTGTCVVTDAAGNRLVKKRNNVAEDINPLNRPTLDVNGNPARAGTWKFKYKDGPTYGEQRAKEKAEARFDMGKPALSSHLQRDERGFVNFSEFIRLLDSGPSGKVLGIVSTSNYRLDQMPAEVARRIAPTGNEIFVNRPSAKNLADVIQVRFPGLSFSDGYGIKEASELIGKHAFKYGWTAPKLITNINQLANAIKDSKDPKVAIPCKGLCKLIAKAETFQNIVDEAKAKKQQRELKAQREAVAASSKGEESNDIFQDDLENERLMLERESDVNADFDELLNENDTL